MVQLFDSWCSWDSVWEGLGFHFGTSGTHLGNLLEDFGSKMAPRGGQEGSNGPQGEGKSESNGRMVSNVPPRVPNGAPEPPKCMPQAPKMNQKYYPGPAKLGPAWLPSWSQWGEIGLKLSDFFIKLVSTLGSNWDHI